MLILLIGCRPVERTPEPRLIFVSHGIVIKDKPENEFRIMHADSIIYPKFTDHGNVRFYQRTWRPGDVYSIRTSTREIPFTAPRNAQTYLLDRIELEDADHFATVGDFPDATVSISPSNRWVGIGSFHGYIRVYDTSTASIVWSRKLSEGMVRNVRILEADSLLIVGEQSIDGYIYGMDLKSGSERWRYRLSDDLERSAIPSNDRFWIYSLPGVFEMKVSDDRLIYISGIHSWRENNEARKRSRLYVFEPGGDRIWAWPETSLKANIQDFDISDQYVVMVISGNEVVKNPVYPDGTVVLLERRSGRLLDTTTIPPLTPHFQSVTLWKSLAIDATSRRVVLGLFDGRIIHLPIENGRFGELQTESFGTPFLVNDVPVIAGISFAAASTGGVYLSVNQSGLPFRYSRENNMTNPPSLHPKAGYLIRMNVHGEIDWQYRDGRIFSDIHVSDDGQTVMAVVDEKKENVDRKFFGYALFRVLNDTLRHVADYPSFVPPFYRGAISPDGLIKAVVTAPYRRTSDDAVNGRYEVHITF